MEMKDVTSIRMITDCAEGRKVHKFNLHYYVFQDEGMFIAYCPALDLTTSGVDFNDAVAQFYENFQLYVECCLQEGTLLDDLKAHGWKVTTASVQQPTFEQMLSKSEFRSLMEGEKEYDRLNARVELQPMPA